MSRPLASLAFAALTTFGATAPMVPVRAEDGFTIPVPADAPDPDTEPGEPPPEDTETPAAPEITGTVVVSEKDEGRRIAADVGNEIIIRLPANRTTGYNWELRDFEKGVLDYLSGDYEAPEGENPFFGAPGVTVLRLVVLRPGAQDLQLIYRRPWDKPDVVARTFAVRIVVGDAEAAPDAAASPPAPDGESPPAPTATPAQP